MKKLINDQYSSLRKPKREKRFIQESLFEVDEDWKIHYWGMPHYESYDAQPYQRITINFLNEDDVKKFSESTGLKITSRTNSAWYPNKPKIDYPSQWEYISTNKARNKYPIYIPSKGRHDCCYTAKALDKLGLNYHVVIEPTEEELYRKHIYGRNILVLPFHDLGQGSIPSRNWIWEHSIENFKTDRHWVIDDNIHGFYRLNMNRRIQCNNSSIFIAIEDFTDRYENVAFSGMNYLYLAKDQSRLAPFNFNRRVYSNILVNNSITHRWRGRYNEDTDICLRALKDGMVTILFNSFLADKQTTLTMKGGNTDTVYATNDHRLAFAESLKEQHPDCVEVIWKFGRWHHSVNYSLFKKNKPILKEGITPIQSENEYGMQLRKTIEPEPRGD